MTSWCAALLQNSGQLPAASCGPCCLGEVGAALRITLPGAPVFSLALDSEATGSGLRQVRIHHPSPSPPLVRWHCWAQVVQLQVACRTTPFNLHWLQFV